MASSKRARGTTSGAQPVFCLVDGCNSDLSNCRDYHRRHKVCELHSKTPQVTIAGQTQRFCQQCSRFHSLEEFDEGKRSCRKRLDGHNRRRRKLQTDLLPRSGSFFSYHQGSQMIPFSSSQVFSSTAAVSHDWPSAADPSRNQQLNFLEKQTLFVDQGGGDYKSGQELAFLEGESHGDLACRPFLRTMNTLSESGGERDRMGYDRFTIGVGESDCALSLLSSQRTQTDRIPADNSGEMGLSRIEQRSAISLQQPLSHNGYESADSVRISSEGNGVVNYPGMFGIGSDSVGNESPSTLPFLWE